MENQITIFQLYFGQPNLYFGKGHLGAGAAWPSKTCLLKAESHKAYPQLISLDCSSSENGLSLVLNPARSETT